MLRGVRRALVVGTLVTLTAPAAALVPRGTQAGPRVDGPGLTALTGAGIDKPLREHRTVRYGQEGGWQLVRDVATGVPTRMWGEGIAAPGAVAEAAIAERVARQVLADQLALLAPGARVEDFELVTNRLDGTMRTVGFVQRAGGKRVVGGQVSFRFKADRLFVIGSEALPHVSVAMPRSRIGLPQLHERAKGTLRMELGLPRAPVTPVGEEMILPLVADDAVLAYRVVRPLTIDGGIDGRYLGYVDVATGAVIAVRQLNAYANGVVKYRVVDRYPSHGRIDRIADRAYVTVGGEPQATTMQGAVSWGSDTDVEIQSSAVGSLVAVTNKAMGEVPAAGIFTLSPSGVAVWDATGVPEEDAQVNAYVATATAKEYVRNYLDAAMPTLDEQMPVNVNLAQTCNAFFDGSAINFFQSSDSCQNTALIEDVVYHEYGHRVHTAEIIDGVGAFDRSMSEGAADFLAASITGDPGMGRGFFYLDSPLRDLDPVDNEWTWPRDVGEIHTTGKIYAGIFWDLRKDLIAQLGETAGIALVNQLYLGTLRRAVDIPTSLIEALAEDDDDGNIANGTPHECSIRDAYGKHGLRTTTGTIDAPGRLIENARSIGVKVALTGLSDACTGDDVAKVEISWLPGYGGIPTPGTQEATLAGKNTYFAQLPVSPQESVYYQAKVTFTDGSFMTLADNAADPYYQLYQGETVTLYCTSFDDVDPFSEGWTTGTEEGEESPFQWGEPAPGGVSDPPRAFSGANIIGMNLEGDYNPNQTAWLKSPPINIGHYSDVRLHYRRWLAVEDSYYDQAMITANGKKAWMNLSADNGSESKLHHIDKEWRFQDVALSSYASGHEFTVGWQIKSDEGLELGGWNIDDVCIVANPYAICGDGVKTVTEQCDQGAANVDLPDLCRTDCRLPKCGDEIVDTGEECDEGPDGNAVCSAKCVTIGPADSGCCSASGGGPRALTLAGLVGLLLLRRRRRR